MIKTWQQRCDEHPDHQQGIVTQQMIQDRMQEEIDELRQALAQPETTVENNSQNWEGMDGAVAWHLIDRHADNWADVGKMMDEWLKANQTLAQPEHEPATWMNKKSAFMCGKTDESGVAFHIITTSKQTKHHTVPLYTAPPKREWVGFADDELPEGATHEFDRGVRWAEAKLKEKNT